MNIFYPIEFLLSKVFELSYKITSNYGYALILMSVVITIITTPLYFLADIWKNKEKKIQDLMKDDIECIKRNFSGQKQFYLTQTTYRIFNYKTWYPLRTSVGILIQIPFFMAAYNVLTKYTGYDGVSFGPIKNLGTPDALLGSINLLPILMTLVNIISSFLYTKSFRLKDNTQQIVLAVVFLLFLYNSPSALLIYWTFNNIFSLIKNLIVDIFSKSPETKTTVERKSIKNFYYENKQIIVILSCFTFFICSLILQNYFFNYVKFELLFLCVIQFSIFCFKFVFKKKLPSIDLLFIYCIYGFFVILYLLDLSFITKNLQMFLLNLFNTLLFYYNFANEDKITFSKKERAILCLLFSLAFTVLLPLQTYFANRIEFSFSVKTLLSTLLPIFLIFSCVSILLSLFVFKKTNLISKTILFIFICYIFYGLLLPIDAGLMSEFSFQNDSILLKSNANLFFLDIVILLFAIYIFNYLINNKRKFVTPFIVIITLIFSFSTFSSFIKNKDINIYTQNSLENSSLPQNAYEIHKLSSNGKNVIFFMADMLNGNYFERLITEQPEIKKDLEGFIYYKDTLSISSCTLNSMPGLFGGSDYGPIELNKTENTFYVDQQLSLYNFFNQFINEKYEVSNVGYFDHYQCDVDKIDENAIYYNDKAQNYKNYYLKEKNITLAGSNSKIYLTQILPIYNFVPYTIKRIVYDDGEWNNPKLQISARQEFTLRSLPHIDLLPELTKITNDSVNTFKFYANELTHDSYGIYKDGNLFSTIADLDTEDKAYFSAKKYLLEFVDFINYLKENNIYDNTLIILCSDHGNLIKDNELCNMNFNNLSINTEELYNHLSRAHAMFLVKDFSAGKDSLQVDYSQLQNSDVVHYIDEKVFEKNNSFSDILKYNENNPRQRTYSYSLYQKNDYNEQITMPFVHYSVNGSMFNSDSWSVLE